MYNTHILFYLFIDRMVYHFPPEDTDTLPVDLDKAAKGVEQRSSMLYQILQTEYNRYLNAHTDPINKNMIMSDFIRYMKNKYEDMDDIFLQNIDILIDSDKSITFDHIQHIGIPAAELWQNTGVYHRRYLPEQEEKATIEQVVADIGSQMSAISHELGTKAT